MECLRQLSAEDVNNYTSITTWPLEGTEYLPIDAQTSFREGKYNKDIDIIAGVTRNEGSLLSNWFYPELHGNFTEQEFRDLVQESDFLFHGIPVQNVTDYYLRNVNTSDSQALKHAFYNYFGDILMKCPTYLFAKQFAINAKNTSHNVYYYELTYQAQDVAIYGCVEETMGICHMSDVEFVFGQFEYNLTTPLDLKFSAEIMQMWTQFAKNG
ncbi:unnamed protein product [Oppiella nova]|uniref:Carboxylesterase type B domain-containing protein n=1 Tax=Oppiella nova TaxID=334625 RepID=A0A7R9MRN3_9ACAR|nr:unnamed protein product [Oppiella nova]CAG2182069.1 unnamed protein product [Oppiella nova]